MKEPPELGGLTPGYGLPPAICVGAGSVVY
jgi:hypothetical protein